MRGKRKHSGIIDVPKVKLSQIFIFQTKNNKNRFKKNKISF